MEKKSRAYYQYMLDVCDKKTGYYSSDDIEQITCDLLDDGEYEEALHVCKIGTTQHPGDEVVELMMSRVLCTLKRYDEAEQLLDAHPDEKSAFCVGVRFGIDINRNGAQQALDTLRDRLAEKAITPLEFIEIIDEHFNDLPNDITADCLRKAVSRIRSKHLGSASEEAEVLARIGAILMDCNCHRDAIPVLEKALDLDAYDCFTWQDLARCQFSLEMWPECRQSCEMGLAIDPTNPMFNFALGYIHCQEGEMKEGVHHLELMRQYLEGKLQHDDTGIDSRETEQQANMTYEMLGHAYITLDELDKARECMEILAQRMPTFADPQYQLCLIKLHHGDVNAGLNHINNAIRLDPSNDTYLSLRVTLNMELRNYDEAISDLNKLLFMHPHSQKFLLAKAELLLSTEHHEEADAAFRSLLKLKPKDHVTCSLMRSYFEAIGDSEALKKIK